MFGRWSREQGTQAQDREIPSKVIDQVYGGVPVGAAAPQAAQAVVVLMRSTVRTSGFGPATGIETQCYDRTDSR
jgi:hypothetical protein